MKEEKEEKEKEDKEEKYEIHPVYLRKRTLGERGADFIAKWGGSWFFIFFFFLVVILWISVNIYGWINQWDPYPFILLNLVLSLLAAIQAPIILMSQNRQSQTDRIRAEYDYSTNRHAAREINQVNKQLDRIEKKINKHFHIKGKGKFKQKSR